MDQSERNGVKVRSAAALAVWAVSLFLATTVGVVAADKTEANVQCKGINACKGKSECSTASNACKGQNACKGRGWVSMSEKECLAKGGKVEKG